MIDFIYHGAADVPQDSINDFLKTAQTLDIKGLADDKAGNKQVRIYKNMDETLFINKTIRGGSLSL